MFLSCSSAQVQSMLASVCCTVMPTGAMLSFYGAKKLPSPATCPWDTGHAKLRASTTS